MADEADWYVVIEAKQTVADEALDPEDVGQVAGIYAVRIDPEIMGLPREDWVESALAVFHDRIGIHTLDHFEIEPRIAPGAEVPGDAQDLGEARQAPRSRDLDGPKPGGM